MSNEGTERLLDTAKAFTSDEVAADILLTYLRLHDSKRGVGWLWFAAERVAAGDDPRDVLADFGYRRIEEPW